MTIRVECARRNTQGLNPTPPSSPLCPGHIPVPAAPLCGGDFHHRWGDPKEGGWGWEPHHQETWSPGGFSSSPEAPHPLGAVGVVSLQEDPLDLEVVGPCRGEQARQVHGAGLIAWHILPSSISPMTVHPWEPSLPRLQGCASSPGHQGPRGIESAFSFCDLYFILVYR